MGLMEGFLRRTLFPVRFVVEDGGGAGGAAGGSQGAGGDGSAGTGDAGEDVVEYRALKSEKG